MEHVYTATSTTRVHACWWPRAALGSLYSVENVPESRWQQGGQMCFCYVSHEKSVPNALGRWRPGQICNTKQQKQALSLGRHPMLTGFCLPLSASVVGLTTLSNVTFRAIPGVIQGYCGIPNVSVLTPRSQTRGHGAPETVAGQEKRSTVHGVPGPRHPFHILF